MFKTDAMTGCDIQTLRVIVERLESDPAMRKGRRTAPSTVLRAGGGRLIDQAIAERATGAVGRPPTNPPSTGQNCSTHSRCADAIGTACAGGGCW